MNTIRGDKSLWEKLNATKCDISIGTILNDTKGVIRIRISKDRQDNDQKKKDRQDNDQKKKDRQDNDQKKKKTTIDKTLHRKLKIEQHETH